MSQHDPKDDSSDEAPVPGLRGLAMDSQPQRDLWPGIAARIVVRRNRQRRVWLAAAACTLMAFSAMLSLRVAETPEVVSTARAPIAAPPEIAAMTLPSGMKVRANRQLVKANLRLTEGAENEVRAAMRQSPDNPALQSLLDATREQQRELNEMLLAAGK
jgi:hypothetical protein